ncbi:hypothetical protein BDY21DRAFT_356427 [Lineolata rhizophorae]|uniref:Uncharacterized protein n=1 Tax=Lineolata rhizophorae TaxID=578093 RepID=A0A6A6NPM1_9PEZI|nr:hypothetical protein BDY21DRAFT_356427 [Lineolata rhizophorae]
MWGVFCGFSSLQRTCVGRSVVCLCLCVCVCSLFPLLKSSAISGFYYCYLRFLSPQNDFLDWKDEWGVLVGVGACACFLFFSFYLSSLNYYYHQTSAWAGERAGSREQVGRLRVRWSMLRGWGTGGVCALVGRGGGCCGHLFLFVCAGLLLFFPACIIEAVCGRAGDRIPGWSWWNKEGRKRDSKSKSRLRWGCVWMGLRLSLRGVVYTYLRVCWMDFFSPFSCFGSLVGSVGGGRNDSDIGEVENQIDCVGEHGPFLALMTLVPRLRMHA